MNSTERKLREAWAEIIDNGEKISFSAIEKRAGRTNGALSYYPELKEEILVSKNKQKKPDKTSASGDKLKKLRAKARVARQEKNDSQKQIYTLKSDKEALVNEIATLTWALHNAQKGSLESNIINKFNRRIEENRNCLAKTSKHSK